jgi:hypothetical protein
MENLILGYYIKEVGITFEVKTFKHSRTKIYKCTFENKPSNLSFSSFLFWISKRLFSNSDIGFSSVGAGSVDVFEVSASFEAANFFLRSSSSCCFYKID